MTRRSFHVLLMSIAIVAVAAAALAQPETAGDALAVPLQGPPAATRQAAGAAERLAGAWQLVTRTVKKSDGSSIDDPVLGQQPLGRLFYDASGVMMLQMMRQGRSAAIGTPANPRDASNPRVVLGYDAYFGRFTVDERAGTITHHVEGSLFPDDLGDDFVRPFTLEGDTLTLRFTSTADASEITRTLVFRRLR
jgi:Lipocalin-like domain